MTPTSSSPTSSVQRERDDFPPLPRLGFRERHTQFLKDLRKDISTINSWTGLGDMCGRNVYFDARQKVLDDMNREYLITNDPNEDLNRRLILQYMLISVNDSIKTNEYYQWQHNLPGLYQQREEIENAYAKFQAHHKRKVKHWV